MEQSDVNSNNDEQQADRLSKLPDEFLLVILEKLDICDAVRTSTLSRRWRQLPSLSKLVLDALSFFSEDGKSEITAVDFARANATLVEATNSFLGTSSRLLIRFLSIWFYLREDDSISIGRLVGNAMQSREVVRADFTILTEKPGPKCTEDDLLDHARRFRLFVDACPHAFGGLTHLQLSNSRFTESDIPNVLATSKKPRFLRLYNCDSGDRLLIQVEHSELTELVFEYCNFERIDLHWLPKLTRLTCRSSISLGDPLSFGHVPCLSRLNLINVGVDWHKTLTLSKFLGNASVSNLHLNSRGGKIWIKPEGPKLLASALHKLRALTLVDIQERCDLNWTIFLLEAAPILKKLYITLRDHICYREKGIPYCKEKSIAWEASNFKHKNFRVLTIYGFQADEKFIRFIRRVMASAVNLDEISLHVLTVLIGMDRFALRQDQGIPKKTRRGNQ